MGNDHCMVAWQGPDQPLAPVNGSTDAIIPGNKMSPFAQVWAHEPEPNNGQADVSVDTKLCWEPGEGAKFHKVYFGTDPCALDYVALIPASYPPEYYPKEPNLVASTTYYWQIVEVNWPDSWTGPVWSFSTIRGEAQPDFPADGAVIVGSEYGGNIYTWLDYIMGPTTVRFTGYCHENYNKVLTRHQDANLGPPPYSTMPTRYYVGLSIVEPYTESLERGITYFWTIDGKDDQGNVFYGDIWEFTVQDVKASFPNPPNEAVSISTDVLLSWHEGYFTSGSKGGHDVYMGTSWNDVFNADKYDTTGIFKGYIYEPNYQCSNLAFGTRYYWRIDEFSGCWHDPHGTKDMNHVLRYTYVKGDVWCFTTVPTNSSAIKED
jgi:hypothetical protein